MLPALRRNSAAGLLARHASAASSAAPYTSFEEHFAAVRLSCAEELTAYGACVNRRLESLERGVCSKEFAALKACADTSLAGVRKLKRGGQ